MLDDFQGCIDVLTASSRIDSGGRLLRWAWWNLSSEQILSRAVRSNPMPNQPSWDDIQLCSVLDNTKRLGKHRRQRKLQLSICLPTASQRLHLLRRWSTGFIFVFVLLPLAPDTLSVDPLRPPECPWPRPCPQTRPFNTASSLVPLEITTAKVGASWHASLGRTQSSPALLGENLLSLHPGTVLAPSPPLRRPQTSPLTILASPSGIGLETSILFAKEGANVLMADISAPALEKAKAKVLQLVPSASVDTALCDVSKEAQVQALVEKLDSAGGLDVMFNNAGIMHGRDADAVETPEEIWDLTQNINVKGVWFGCKHAVLSLRRHKKTKGSIINTASVVALVGAATPQLAYTASKGAVLALTRELAMVHARDGYRFNSLCPAPLNTPLLQDWLGDDKEKRLRREVHFPTGRFGEAVEQAQAVLFLASDESSFVNGHVSNLPTRP